MMILLNLWLILSLSEAAPLISNMDKEVPEEDIVTDDIQSVDIVNGDGMDSDELHSHTSHNTSRDAKHIFYGGNINFSGTIHATGDHARINIGSISSNALSQEPYDEPDYQEPHDKPGPQVPLLSEDPPLQFGSAPTNYEVPLLSEDPPLQFGSAPTNYEGCVDDEFSCSSGECIDKDFRCDTVKDCQDGSDEINCEEDTVCQKDEINPTACSCRNPTGNEVSVCSAGQRCKVDGTCQDGCKADEFSCSSGDECVLLEYRCDDEPDCFDGSDEQDCNSDCAADQYHCPSGECIDPEMICDGDQNCGDGSDEEIHRCQNEEKRRKRSTQTVNIIGKIVLPADLDFTFPTNSRIYVSCDDISNLQSTNLGIAVIDVSNKPSEEDISYVLEADLPNYEQITMSATINVGWNRDPNSEEWIRKGDFHNDVSHSLDVVEDTAEYEKDISVVVYDY